MTKYSILFLLIAASLLNSYGQDVEQEKNNLLDSLSKAAIELTKTKVTFDPSYFVIDYPNGDIPEHLGVNADVIIRAYRKIGIDLQKEVHEDITQSFDQYPNEIWGNTEPDTNIDHRRVPNLQAFFSRKGEVLPIDQDNNSYKGGDIVIWKLPDGTNHIGIVTNEKSQYGTPLVVHNSTSGQRLQNVLFHFKIIGHYRYTGIESTSQQTEERDM